MAEAKKRGARGRGAFGTRVVGVKLPSLCVAPADIHPEGKKTVRAVIFIPHSTYLDDGFDIGGYTATVSIPASKAASVVSENRVVIPFDRAESITFTREGSPRLTLDPIELAQALRNRRDRFSDELARRERPWTAMAASGTDEAGRHRTGGFQPTRAPGDARGQGGSAS